MESDSNEDSCNGSSTRASRLSGDEEFREYVLARRDVLMREAYLLTGDSHKAEDLVQTALAKAYAAWPRVRSCTSPDAYVRRILINTNISRSGGAESSKCSPPRRQRRPLQPQASQSGGRS